MKHKPRIDHKLIVVASRLAVVEGKLVVGEDTLERTSWVGLHTDAVGDTVVAVLIEEDMVVEVEVERILVHKWDWA